MSALNGLKLVAAVKINAMSPVQFRRNKLMTTLPARSPSLRPSRPIRKRRGWAS